REALAGVADHVTFAGEETEVRPNGGDVATDARGREAQVLEVEDEVAEHGARGAGRCADLLRDEEVHQVLEVALVRGDGVGGRSALEREEVAELLHEKWNLVIGLGHGVS